MQIKPTYVAPIIKDILVLPSAGPWPTKSNGQLNVLFGIAFPAIIERYFHYETSELNKISVDIRGLRSYRVNMLKNKSVGANEWHRVRNELVFATKGSFKWTCEDVHGNSAEFIVNQQSGLWVPPFILHTYEVLQDDTEILVIANTLFIPDNPSTHDSYNPDDFKKLQKQYIA